jgi:hypothetical protein
MVTLLVIVFGGIAFVNYTVDPGNIYHSQECIDKIIEGIKKGYNVEGITNLDERLYKLRFAELHKGENFDYLALGSSRILTISEDMLNGSSLINLGISGCHIEELIAFYQICKDFNIHFSNVLVAADPSLFNGHEIDDRWTSTYLDYYFNEFMGICATEQKRDWRTVWNFFSVSYFKAALKSYMEDHTILTYVKTVKNNGNTFLTDGSFYWGKSVRETPQSVVDEEAKTELFNLYNNFDSISSKRVALFTRLIEGIKGDNVTIYFVCPPFHPIFYKKLLNTKGAVDAFNLIDSFAINNNIPIIGSFNPADEGLNKSNFYDGPHVRIECLEKIVKRELFN